MKTDLEARVAALECGLAEITTDRDLILEELAVYRATFQAVSAALGVVVQPASLPTNES